jgi:uncharacterized membrane protein
MLAIFLLNLLALMHFVVIPLVGLVMALKRWRRQPRLALAAGGGFALFILAACTRAWTTTLVLERAQQGAPPGGNAFHAADALGLAAIAMEALALVLVTAAVFGWRQQAARVS